MAIPLDAFQIRSGSVLRSDICVVGAGAVGIAIAREFAEISHQVLLLESSDFQPDALTQSLHDVENIGHPLRMDTGYSDFHNYETQ
ncbi:MAG: hypothetical protein IGR92_17115 [Leptolyngbyaceae cyanobacterium T60_A2020_046]|nr:hypothetical protein [Leptolyngbyaceae cyanobacterium T60_A2020_046]